MVVNFNCPPTGLAAAADLTTLAISVSLQAAMIQSRTLEFDILYILAPELIAAHFPPLALLVLAVNRCSDYAAEPEGQAV